MATPDAALALLDHPNLADDNLDRMPPGILAVLDSQWVDRTDPANPVTVKSAHLTRTKSATLYNVVSAAKPARTLEIGLFSGASAIVIMAAALRDGYAGHIAMDPAQKKQAESRGLKNIDRAGLQSKFVLMETESCYGLPFLILEKAMTFDFAFIDASHHFDHTLLEFFYIDRMIPVGAIIAFDDVSTPAVEAVINYISVNRHYACRRIGALVFAVKMSEDVRYWFEFNKFDVPDTEAFMAKKHAENGKPPRLKQY